ncbi:acyltransferase [Simplicispira psychrophila]|uniref:acyltransferase family protein n=1 Tax=Simplicispira psychrophila TaxID=80882 RepID=UPI00316ACF91
MGCNLWFLHTSYGVGVGGCRCRHCFSLRASISIRISSNMGNSFDLLRLAAALAVFFAHGDFLYRLHLPVPFPGHSLGSLAVSVFFFISGYLVCQSWIRKPTWRVFWVKRLTRVFPGLVVAVAFSVFVLGWAVTTLPSAAYWQASSTWLNFVNNAVGLATVQTLPGVFESNPFARAVNGSLWTIRYELAMYGVLSALSWGMRGRRWVYPATALVLACLWQLARMGAWDAALEATGGPMAELFRWSDFCGFGVPFFAGSTFAVYAVRPRQWMAVVALLAVVGGLYAESALLRQMAVWVLMVCGTFYLAHVRYSSVASAASAGHGRVDLSYGVYIYAFPVQQAVTALCLARGWSFAVCLLVSLVPIVLLAWLSWFGVEQPCMRAAQRWLHRINSK